jgi:tRNA(Ile)-lysidine synthase
VLETALRNTRLLQPGERLGVAVSGGADSIALLSALHALSRFQLTALHVNHGLRGAESEADEQFVRAFARELGVGVLVYRAVLPAGNVEASGRQARYSWFRELLAQGAVDRIATAHTASDQAETVLFRFLRGAGTAGLAGVRPCADGVVRPLLDVTGEDVRRYLRGRGIAWREDSSNGDLRFARNRIRHELLPALTRDWNPALPEVLSQTAEWARAEEEYWGAEAVRLSAQCVQFETGAAILATVGLSALPLAAARRVVRFAISAAKGDLSGIDFPHVERILELAARPEGRGRLQIPGLDARRSFGWVRLSADDGPAPVYSETLQVPGEIQVPYGGPLLHLELKNPDSVYNTIEHQLDWGLLSGSLKLRNWRPGDYYRQAGHSSETKLKHLFHRARIPWWERRQWPVITLENSIVWTRKFGPAAGFAPSSGTDTVLMVREVPPRFGENANRNV